jgi:hypothetical protein
MATTYPVDLINVDNNELEKQQILSYTGTSAAIPATRNQVSPVGTVTSGALATQQLSSGTGATVSTTRDVETHTPCTLTGVGGTITVALSPDNVTYSTLAVVTPAINASITDVVVRVPAGWFIKLTVASATLGVTTSY